VSRHTPFLDRACAGNEPLRREVQSLLDAHQQAGYFLERPLARARSFDNHPPSRRGKAKRHRGPSAPREHALKSLAHTGRFSPVTIGFWLGGVGMGTGGCLLGALMPYRHPVAVAISVLWWGLYFGCFGASVGALVGAFTDRAPPRPSVGRERAEEVATKLGLDSRAARAGSTAVCAPGGQRGLLGHHRERARPA
jgi:hypothetical protein